MFFNQESFSFNIMDVLELNQKNINASNSGRNFNALSFRFRANTTIKTGCQSYQLRDNFITYVPARLDYARISAVDKMIVIHFDTTNYNSKSIEIFESTTPEKLISLFQTILECWNKKEPGYKLKCSALLYEILNECYIQNFKSEKSTSKIQNSIDYIQENYKRSDLTIPEIAKQSFMSDVYFRKLFKQAYGISPQKYITNLRIQNAKGLIATGYYHLKEIARLSGYEDYKYFLVDFKKQVGVTPSKYSYNYRE